MQGVFYMDNKAKPSSTHQQSYQWFKQMKPGMLYTTSLDVSEEDFILDQTILLRGWVGVRHESEEAHPLNPPEHSNSTSIISNVHIYARIIGHSHSLFFFSVIPI